MLSARFSPIVLSQGVPSLGRSARFLNPKPKLLVRERTSCRYESKTIVGGIYQLFPIFFGARLLFTFAELLHPHCSLQDGSATPWSSYRAASVPSCVSFACAAAFRCYRKFTYMLGSCRGQISSEPKATIVLRGGHGEGGGGRETILKCS